MVRFQSVHTLLYQLGSLGFDLQMHIPLHCEVLNHSYQRLELVEPCQKCALAERLLVIACALLVASCDLFHLCLEVDKVPHDEVDRDAIVESVLLALVLEQVQSRLVRDQAFGLSILQKQGFEVD